MHIILPCGGQQKGAYPNQGSSIVTQAKMSAVGTDTARSIPRLSREDPTTRTITPF